MLIISLFFINRTQEDEKRINEDISHQSHVKEVVRFESNLLFFRYFTTNYIDSNNSYIAELLSYVDEYVLLAE